MNTPNQNAVIEKLKTLERVGRIPAGDGFQFIGYYADGESLVLRARATRPYTTAAIHSTRQVTKFVSTDPRAYVTFHGTGTPRASKYGGDEIVKTIACHDYAAIQIAKNAAAGIPPQDVNPTGRAPFGWHICKP